ncbi:hypothetical protein FHG87_025408, partial [Trinorchestia longiramus]
AGLTLSQQQRYKLMLVVSCPSVQLSAHDNMPRKAKHDQLQSYRFQLRCEIRTFANMIKCD